MSRYPKTEKAQKPCPARIFGKRKSPIVSDTLVSKLSDVFVLSDGNRTRGLYHPKRGWNIFLGILYFFRPFRYGKNDLSRSRGILSPGAPIVSMVAYVVVKIHSKIDGFSLIGSGWFFIKISGQTMWSLLTDSAYQGRCIVPLLQPFVKSVCD